MKSRVFSQHFFRYAYIFSRSRMRRLMNVEEVRMKTVLIVDDERDAVDVLSLMLEMSGFAVMVAYNGVQAAECVAQKHPDLILSDFMMPGMDGIALCRRIKADPDTADIPFILMTAAANLDDDAPLDIIVTKPVEINKLLEAFAALDQGAGKPPLRLAR